MCKRLSRKGKRLCRRVIFLSICLIIFFVLRFLKENSVFCEIYTRKVGRVYQSLLGPLVAPVPFSIMELGALICFVLLLIFLIGFFKNLKRRNVTKAFIKLFNGINLVALILVLYMGTAEIPYNRKDIGINYYSQNVEKTDFKTIINHFVDDINYCCESLSFKDDGELDVNYSVSELSKLCEAEYERLSDNDYFTPFTTTCKPMISSFIYRECHITGFTFLPTTEANVNTLNVEGGKPFTFLHELAHSKGVMREDDAQKVAMCLSLTSSNAYLRFSGYYYTFNSLLSLAKHTGVSSDYNEIYNRINPNFLRYFKFANDYWDAHNLLDDLAEWWNNLYLKSSGVEEGTQSYVDPPAVITEDKIVFSNYQKIYFSIYYGLELL